MGIMIGSAQKPHVVLEAVDLVKDFGTLRAVDHLSLTVFEGEIFGFLGPNGAGKTTSLRMICGLLKPTSGEIRIDGEPILASGSGKPALRVGICPQENILWNKLTCFEQLVFIAAMYGVPRREARDRAGLLLERMGLGMKRNKLAGTLSGGMKRRLNVIMTLMHDPDIMIFDEPEAGLDPQSRVVVREFIRETARNRTVIVTTHNMDEAERVADRVGIIDAGRMLKLDSPDRLKRSIGEGDILELKLYAKDPSGLDRSESILKEKGFELTRDRDTFTIRSMDLVSRIREIYRVLEQEEVTPQEMKLRENTLEDVFIHLTGKSLRS